MEVIRRTATCKVASQGSKEVVKTAGNMNGLGSKEVRFTVT